MSSEGVEHLASVLDNPFIRQFGLHSNTGRQDAPDSEPSIPSSASSDKGDDDGEQEYHVNSGFVNKLRSKFAQLESKSNRITLSKKSASVENLLSISSSKDAPNKSHRWQRDDSAVSSSTTKVDFRKPVGYRPQIRRPGSVELGSSDKSSVPKKKEIEIVRQNNVIRSVKPPLPKKSTFDSSSRNKTYSRKANSDTAIPKPEHHDWKLAPDMEKIGRDNIVIIESKKPEVYVPVHKSKQSSVIEDSTDGFRKVKPVTEMEQTKDENELPKPNTVSQFRTLFEKPHRTVEILSAWRHHSPTRKSSESDSPGVTSPRSPLKTNDDNVFDATSKVSIRNEKEKSLSPRNSLNVDTKIQSPRNSPRNSSSNIDYSQNVDTTPTQIQKSMEMFNRRGSVDNELKSDKSKYSYSEKDSYSSGPLSPSIQHTLTPVHPMSKVFDSKSVTRKTDKEKNKNPKPAIVTKKPHQFVIPKDIIELKHEAEKPLRQELLNKKSDLVLEVVNDTVEVIEQEPEPVSEEPTVKPSSKSGKISPRQTKVFDSSNIVKKNKELPKVFQNDNRDMSGRSVSENVPKQVSIEIKDVDKSRIKVDKEVPMESSPEKQIQNQEKVVNRGMTEITTNIVEKPKPRKFKVKEQNFIKAESVKEDVKPEIKPAPEKTEAPVSGMSSFLASRLKKTQPDQENQLKTSSVHLANGSSPSPVPKKRQAPERPVANGPKMDISAELEKSAPPLPKTPEPALERSNNNILSRQKKKTPQQSTKMVFDSSKIAVKRKEPPKRKPPKKTIDQINQGMKTETNAGVPKLDLSSITADKQESEYQEGYIPTIIKPCTIKFAGAGVTFEKNPLKKSKTGKVKKTKISFDDHATTTFEYEGEDSALQSYLEDHPDELDEAMSQDSEVNGVSDGPLTLDDMPDVPVETEHHMKSNTVIGTSGGGLTSYKSKMQTMDFQFGMTPEPEVTNMPEPDVEEQEHLDLLPADDSELDMFSAELEKSDMLF